MSYFDSLYIANDLTVSDTLKQIHQFIGFEVNPTIIREKIGSDERITRVDAANELWSVSARTSVAVIYSHGELLSQIFGFRPNISLNFTFRKQNISWINEQMFQMIFEILQRTKWNVAYVMLDSDLELIRSNSNVKLHISAWAVRMSERLNENKSPYRIEDLPRL